MTIIEALQATLIAQVDELQKCDICGAEHARFDVKTVFGPWGYVCSECFKRFAASNNLGLGKGQLLLTEEEFANVDDNTDFETVLSKTTAPSYSLIDIEESIKPALSDSPKAILLKGYNLPIVIDLPTDWNQAYDVLVNSLRVTDEQVTLRDSAYDYPDDTSIIHYAGNDSICTTSVNPTDIPKQCNLFFTVYSPIVIYKTDDNDTILPFTENDLSNIAKILFEQYVTSPMKPEIQEWR